MRLYGDGDTILKRIEPMLDDTMVRINLSNTSYDTGYLRTGLSSTSKWLAVRRTLDAPYINYKTTSQRR